MSANVVNDYSGVVLAQSQKPSAGDYVTVTDGAWRYQDFYLPSDYSRDSNVDARVIPPLTGFQVLVGVTDADGATLEWKVERQLFGSGWTTLAQGTQVGAHVQGNRAWVDLPFAAPVGLDEDAVDDRFRIGMRAVDGVDRIWYSVPNPLALRFARATGADGVTAIQNDGQDVSFLFRILGLIADDGVDFLGNNYRSAVVVSGIENINTVDGAVQDRVWRSKPNPSRFAVESLYFDLRSNTGGTRVIDRVLIDPETPNIWFSVYYSSEGDPPASEEEWENKLWERVPATYQATKREAHALPKPVIAKYLKIEFTHLQAKPYNPGDFARPVTYKKHPKWVLDYFLARTEAARDEQQRLYSGRIAIVYDAYDLAFNYYLDDLRQAPEQPIEVGRFLADRSDFADKVDPAMLGKIRLALQPYQQHISNFATDTLLGQQAHALAYDGMTDHAVETPRSWTTSSTTDVDSLRNTEVVFEADYPVMFFYLTCRHKYREVVAPLEHDRAYFVGVREVAFLRDNYTAAYDGDLYVESGGDGTNVARNDFVTNGGTMSVNG